MKLTYSIFITSVVMGSILTLVKGNERPPYSVIKSETVSKGGEYCNYQSNPKQFLAGITFSMLVYRNQGGLQTHNLFFNFSCNKNEIFVVFFFFQGLWAKIVSRCQMGSNPTDSCLPCGRLFVDVHDFVRLYRWQGRGIWFLFILKTEING